MLAGAGRGSDPPQQQPARSRAPAAGSPAGRGCGKGNATRGGRGSGPGRAPSGGRCRNRGAEGADGPGTPPRLAPPPVPPAPSRPVPSWRWSARAPAPPTARSDLPRPRLLLVRRSPACERGRDRRNPTSKYLRSECLWILEQNWEFIWKKCCCDCSQTLLQTDFNCCIIFC